MLLQVLSSTDYVESSESEIRKVCLNTKSVLLTHARLTLLVEVVAPTLPLLQLNDNLALSVLPIQVECAPNSVAFVRERDY
jgi:hypothetical protein